MADHMPDQSMIGTAPASARDGIDQLFRTDVSLFHVPDDPLPVSLIIDGRDLRLQLCPLAEYILHNRMEQSENSMD